MLGGLAAHQRGAGNLAGAGDAADDVGDALRDHLAAGDVVGHEQRLGADHHDVIDHHADQVEADGVVDVHGLGDGDLGAHAVGGGGQQRLLVGQQPGDVVQAGESAEPAKHGRAVGGLDGFLHQFDGPVAGFDVHPGGGVGDGVSRIELDHGFSSCRWRSGGSRTRGPGRRDRSRWRRSHRQGVAGDAGFQQVLAETVAAAGSSMG